MDSRTVFRKGDFHVEEEDHDGFRGMSGGDIFGGKIGGSFKPAAGIGRVKAPSVSSGQGKNASEILREKLFTNKSYTITEVLSLLEASGVGVDQATSLTIAKNVTKNIQAINLTIPIAKNITEQEQGRHIIDVVANMAAQGGELLIGILATNFDLTEYTIEVRKTVFECEQLKEVLTSNLVDPVAVDMKFHELMLEHNLVKVKKELLRKYQDLFNARVQPESEEQKAQQDDTPDNARRRKFKWESSPELRAFEVEYAASEETARDSYRETVLNETLRYRKALEDKQEAQVQVARLKVDLERYKIIESRASELAQQMTQVVYKIKNALDVLGTKNSNRNAAMVVKLNQNVVVNGINISAPLATDNLSGIFRNLYNEYSKVSLSYFCDYLMRVLSQSCPEGESDSNPGAAVDRMNQLVQEFNRQNLHTQLTPDQFFTAALLKSYEDGSRARREGLQLVLTSAAKLEEDPDYFTRGSKTLTHLNMPIYSALTDWLTQIYAKSGDFAKCGQTGKSGKDKNRSSSKDVDSGALESAAAADVNEVPSKMKFASGVYSGEVNRLQGLCVKFKNGKTQPYTATWNPCSNCTHVPRCVTIRCNKCLMMGHLANHCHQPPSLASQGGGGGSA